MEVDHDFDVRADSRPQRLHHARDLVHLGQGRVIVRIGDEDCLEGAVALRDDFLRALDQRRRVERLVDGAHVAEAKMRVDAHLVAHLAAEQPPHGNAEVLAENVPQRHLDAGDRAHADHAEPPETCFLSDAHGLLDVAGIAADQQRREIFDGADHGARLPFERRLAPAEQAGFAGLDADEDPVAHVRVDDAGRDAGDLHRQILPQPPKRGSGRPRTPTSSANRPPACGCDFEILGAVIPDRRRHIERGEILAAEHAACRLLHREPHFAVDASIRRVANKPPAVPMRVPEEALRVDG